MSYLEELLKNSTIENTKGGQYYDTSYNCNLDVFSMLSREMGEKEILRLFSNAYNEDKYLATANLLYLLDIREGKGERRLFKICFEWLCNEDKELAIKVARQIGELGRWDYILIGIGTQIKDDIITIIDAQLSKDIISSTPSLLAKWLPTRKRVTDKYNYPYILCTELKITREQYRKTLSSIRRKLNLIETKLANKDYDIDFEKVPTKAILKYKEAFNRNCESLYNEYLEKVSNGEAKINTKGLFAYEIIKNIYEKRTTVEQAKLYNAMWEQQKDILNGYNKNILVMADTSGSMTCGNPQPIWSSIGLAIYMAERNTGIFKDYFMSFSSEPKMQRVMGKDIASKVNNIKCIVEETDIDKAFELLLNTAIENKISQEEMPSHLIIISDMEFDEGVYSKGGTNFKGWKEAFNEASYTLPKIIFWNVSTDIKGIPATKFDNDVALISGFSTAIVENLLDLENLTPIKVMLSKLDKYLKLLEI